MGITEGLAPPATDGLVALLLARGVELILDEDGCFVPSPAGRLSPAERLEVARFQAELDEMPGGGAWC